MAASDSPRTVSVVIPCLNEARHLPGVLAALAAQSFQGFEVVLADGGSEDGTLDTARRWAQANPRIPLRIVPNPHRHIPHALNLGIAAAQGDVIVRLDGHSEPEPEYIAQCLRALAETGADMVGGAWDIQPGAATVTAEAIALAVRSPLGAGDAAYRLGAPVAREVETVPFGCFHKGLWRRLGGYSEALLTNEDYEFATRLRQAGGRVWYTPLIRSHYHARATLRELARQYWRYGWWKAQMLKRHPRSLRLRQALPMAWVLAAGLALLGLALWPALAALWLLPWLVYGAVIAAGAVQLARWRHWRLVGPLFAAFGVIHFGWGLGALAGLILGRRTPG